MTNVVSVFGRGAENVSEVRQKNYMYCKKKLLAYAKSLSGELGISDADPSDGGLKPTIAWLRRTFSILPFAQTSLAPPIIKKCPLLSQEAFTFGGELGISDADPSNEGLLKSKCLASPVIF